MLLPGFNARRVSFRQYDERIVDYTVVRRMLSVADKGDFLGCRKTLEGHYNKSLHDDWSNLRGNSVLPHAFIVPLTR